MYQTIYRHKSWVQGWIILAFYTVHKHTYLPGIAPAMFIIPGKQKTKSITYTSCQKMFMWFWKKKKKWLKMVHFHIKKRCLYQIYNDMSCYRMSRIEFTN